MNKLLTDKGILGIETLKQKWGFSFFLVSFSCAFLSVTVQALSGKTSHDFDIFRASALLAMNGINPYGILYPAGQFLYSPTAALFFYGPLALLPYALGLAIYNLILFLSLILPAIYLEKSISYKYKQLFFLLLTFEAMGSMLNNKLELATAGLFLMVYLKFKNERESWIIALLALVSNFKLQAMAACGLMLTSTRINGRALRNLAIYSVCFLATLAAPMFFLGYAKNIIFLNSWRQQSATFIAGTFSERTHIWKFLSSTFGIEFSTQSITAWTSLTAVAFFCYCIFRGTRQDAAAGVLRALALGSLFAVVLSPAAQSSAYVLLAPMFLAYTLLGSDLGRKFIGIWFVGFALSLFLISLSYSDLVGNTFREFARRHSIKALGGMVLLIFYLVLESTGVSERT